MTDFQTGDMVVLISGSMRMAVEAVEAGQVKVVWCHEGRIGRDSFDAKLLNKWEVREDRGDRGDRGGRPWQDRGERGGDRGGHRGDREGGGKPWQGKGGDRGDRGGDDRPRKTGWDGKPREKKYFRKDG